MNIQGRRFLVVTNDWDSAKRAIPIDCITLLIEFQDENKTSIYYYHDNEEERFGARESFESIMAGDHTVVL